MAIQRASNLVVHVYGFDVHVKDVERDVEPGSYSPTADSDHDYYGWDDLEYEVTHIVDTTTGETLDKHDENEFLEDHTGELDRLVLAALDAHWKG